MFGSLAWGESSSALACLQVERSTHSANHPNHDHRPCLAWTDDSVLARRLLPNRLLHAAEPRVVAQALLVKSAITSCLVMDQ